MDWSAASGELWASILQILAALPLDLSAAALIKYLLLVIAVIALFWAGATKAIAPGE